MASSANTLAPPPPPPPTTDDALPNNPPTIRSPSTDRLSQPFPLRLPLLITITGASGFLLGIRKGSLDASYRFRAEHAHRLPKTQTGWYLYHKSKNYHSALGGIYEGGRMSWRMAPWAGVFVGLEECVDRGRAWGVREWRSHTRVEDEFGDDEVAQAGNKDFVSTMLAGLASAGCFAAWKGMPLPTAVRLMKMGAKVGFGYGVAQDVVRWMQGRRLGYVEFIKRHTVGTSERGRQEQAASAPG